MKEILKVLIYIISIISITLICCILFIKPKVPNFKMTNEFQNVQKNKNNIEEIIVRTETLLGKHCYKLNTDKTYNFLNNVVIKKESKTRCFDSDMYLEVYFKDGLNEEFYFECDNLVYNDIRYELKNKITLYNKDEYMPDKITEDMIIISNKDKIDCK